MKKMVLLVLLSVMSVGVAADNAHAIFGGRAWRVTARQEGFGLFGLRRSKTGRFFRKSASVEVKPHHGLETELVIQHSETEPDYWNGDRVNPNHWNKNHPDYGGETWVESYERNKAALKKRAEDRRKAKKILMLFNKEVKVSWLHPVLL